MNEAKATYYGARRDHEDVYIRHCGSAEPRCTLPSQVALDEAWAAWYVLDDARIIYRRLLDVARESEYPGHIPRRC